MATVATTIAMPPLARMRYLLPRRLSTPARRPPAPPHSISLPVFPRRETLTLALRPTSPPRRPPCIAAARSLPEQIEAAEKLRRDALYLLARGNRAREPSIADAAVLPRPWPPLRRARLPLLQSTTVYSEHTHASRVRAPPSWTHPFFSSPPRS